MRLDQESAAAPEGIPNSFYHVMWRTISQDVDILVKIVDENQGGFVKNGFIHDQFMLAHDVLKWYCNVKQPAVCPKMDLSRSTTVSWSLLQVSMRELGFDEGCISNVVCELGHILHANHWGRGKNIQQSKRLPLTSSS